MTEEEFKKEIYKIHGDSVEVCGHFKNLNNPILIKDKYGILKYNMARQVLKCKTNIKSALNKTEYFFNQLKEKYPEIAEKITPMSEYESAKKKMIFKDKFGLVAISPDALLSGHCPNIRSAVNRKDYFKAQLVYLYDGKYDFIVNSTSRHSGRVKLLCDIHGEQAVDTDWIFSGCGCPMCNTGWTKSNFLYIIQLSNNSETFYKLGVTHKLKNGKLRRFKDYEALGYSIKVLHIKEYEDYEETHDKELELKHIIKDCLYSPKNWPNKSSTECFTTDLINILISKL